MDVFGINVYIHIYTFNIYVHIYIQYMYMHIYSYVHIFNKHTDI
jgi:hypothetical protein